MIERLSNVIYYGFLFLSIAIAIIAFNINDINFNVDFLMGISFAAAVFIMGWAIRYILTGNKSLL
jgi:hypothetical protein